MYKLKSLMAIALVVVTGNVFGACCGDVKNQKSSAAGSSYQTNYLALRVVTGALPQAPKPAQQAQQPKVAKAGPKEWLEAAYKNGFKLDAKGEQLPAYDRKNIPSNAVMYHNLQQAPDGVSHETAVYHPWKSINEVGKMRVIGELIVNYLENQQNKCDFLRPEERKVHINYYWTRYASLLCSPY